MGRVAYTHLDVYKRQCPYAASSRGMALAAWEGRDRADLPDYLRKAAHTLSHARPTTVARMEAITEGCLKAGLEALACGQPADEAIFRYALGLLEYRYTRLSHTAVTLVDHFPRQGTVMTLSLIHICREYTKKLHFLREHLALVVIFMV